MRLRVEPGCTDVPQLELPAATKTNRCNFPIPRESQGTHSQLHDGLDRSFRWKTPVGCECALVTIASMKSVIRSPLMSRTKVSESWTRPNSFANVAGVSIIARMRATLLRRTNV